MATDADLQADDVQKVVLEKLDDMRAHARSDRRTLIQQGTVPELRDGAIPPWRLDELTPWERALYLAARAETLEMWADEVEAAMDRDAGTN